MGVRGGGNRRGGVEGCQTLAIELAQLAATIRSFEILDLVANAVGILLGLILMTLIQRRA